MSAHSRSVEVLLVEDNPGDVRLTKEALREGKLLNNMSVVGDGVEALAYLRRTPVVVLTTSSAAEDIPKTYDLHANCYVTKPVDLEQFMRVVRSIEDFWVSVAKLPSDEGAR